MREKARDGEIDSWTDMSKKVRQREGETDEAPCFCLSTLCNSSRERGTSLGRPVLFFTGRPHALLRIRHRAVLMTKGERTHFPQNDSRHLHGSTVTSSGGTGDTATTRHWN